MPRSNKNKKSCTRVDDSSKLTRVNAFGGQTRPGLYAKVNHSLLRYDGLKTKQMSLYYVILLISR